jgi:hypothetical protein
MDDGNEHRVAVKFRFKAGLSATGTLVLVQKSYDRCTSYVTVSSVRLTQSLHRVYRGTKLLLICRVNSTALLVYSNINTCLE